MYSGADYADEFNDRRSVSGTVVTLGGAAVSWQQVFRSLALSRTEAEYVPSQIYLRTRCYLLTAQSYAYHVSGFLRIIRGPERWVRTFLVLLGASTLTYSFISLES